MIRHSVYSASTRLLGFLTQLMNHKHFHGDGRLVRDRNSHIILSKGSSITISGVLRLNDKCIVNNGRSTILRIDENGRLITKGKTSIFYGGDIIIFRNAELSIGNSFLNSDAKIRCHEKITIGDNCAISHNVTIMDSDAHYLDGEQNKKPIQIGNHVWIGTHVTILSGVTIGDGSVIAAGTLVNKDVPPRSLVAGVPCKVIRNEVDWSE